MRYQVVLAPEAVRAFRALPAFRRAEVRDALERHLRYEPTRMRKSRIKRLRGLSQPQYRLRVGRSGSSMTSRLKPSKSSQSSRKPRRLAGSPPRPMRQVALAEVKDDD